MTQQEVEALIKQLLVPIEERFEKLEREVELLATEIKILKEGGNI